MDILETSANWRPTEFANYVKRTNNYVHEVRALEIQWLFNVADIELWHYAFQSQTAVVRQIVHNLAIKVGVGL